MAQVIDEILQSATVLVACGAEAFFNVIPNPSNLSNVRSQELSETVSGVVFTWGIIQLSDEI
jgi:hypothetical protein